MFWRCRRRHSAASMMPHVTSDPEGFPAYLMSGMLSAVVVGLILGGVLAHRLSRRMTLSQLVTAALSAISIGCFGLSLGKALAVRLGCAVLIGAGGALYA